MVYRCRGLGCTGPVSKGSSACAMRVRIWRSPPASPAEDDAGAQIAAIDRALDLARHADPAHRERDERISEALTPYAPGDDAEEASQGTTPPGPCARRK